VLFEKIFEEFKKRRPYEIGEIRNQKPSKNQENIRNGVNTVSYRKGLRVLMMVVIGHVTIYNPP
jgi:hypothetical protein